MSNELASPLQSLVRKLASTDIQGPAAQMKKRFVGASDTIAVLCDCSGSMCDLVGSSGISKFHHLQIALEDLQKGFPKIRLVAFGSIAKEVHSAKQLPDPERGMGFGASTNLAGALELITPWKPRKTIVISDGLPDSESDALDAAENVTGAIDSIYCGPDSHPAVDFLRRLSRQCAGTSAVWTGTQAGISSTIRALLPAPE